MVAWLTWRGTCPGVLWVSGHIIHPPPFIVTQHLQCCKTHHRWAVSFPGSLYTLSHSQAPFTHSILQSTENPMGPRQCNLQTANSILISSCILCMWALLCWGLWRRQCTLFFKPQVKMRVNEFSNGMTLWVWVPLCRWIYSIEATLGMPLLPLLYSQL